MKKITVIGGGIAGCTTALLLDSVLSTSSPDTWEIVLIEKEHIFSGASMNIARRHYGGEYPKDIQTGYKCLQGAMLFDQMFPHFIYTKQSPISFLIAKEERQLEDYPLSLPEFISYYEKIREKYSEFIDRAIAELPEGSVIREEVASYFFGLPENFFQSLSFCEAPLKYVDSDFFSGGIRSKEIGFDPLVLSVVIQVMLSNSSVKLMEKTDVTAVKKIEKGFSLHLSKEETPDLEMTSNYVVNTAWSGAFSLEDGISQLSEERLPNVNIYKRAMMMIDISGVSEKPPGIFALIGPAGGMYSPFSEKIAFLYYPSVESAYLKSHTVKNANRLLPDDWNNELDSSEQQERLRVGFDEQRKKFPFLTGAVPLALLINDTISYDSDLTSRHYENVISLIPGWFRNIPTKGTYAPIASIQTVQLVLRQLVVNGDFTNAQACQALGFDINLMVQEYPVLLPKQLKLHHFVSASDITYEKLVQAAVERKIPLEMTDFFSADHFSIVRSTKATIGALSTGIYGVTMTIQDALNHGELKCYPDCDKYGFFSPFDQHKCSLAGEITLIRGIPYHTFFDNDRKKDCIQILSLDTEISFGQVMLMEPSNRLNSANHLGCFFKQEGGYVDRINQHAVDGMVVTIANVFFTDETKYRISYEPLEPINQSKYPPVSQAQEYIRTVSGQAGYVLFTNFHDRITQEVDVKSPHLHFVNKSVVDYVETISFKDENSDIRNEAHRKHINKQLINMLEEDNTLALGGHITNLGSGFIRKMVYQPIFQCVMISFVEDGQTEKKEIIPLYRDSEMRDDEILLDSSARTDHRKPIISKIEKLLLVSASKSV